MNFNLPWCGHSKYWLCFKSDSDELLEGLRKTLEIKEFKHEENCLALLIEGDWVDSWNKLAKQISKNGKENYSAIIVNGEEDVDLVDILPSFEKIKVIDTIAENFWLGDDLCKGKFICYLQEIQDRKGEVFGYESFVRAEKDGEIASGWEIIQAAHDLKIHHILDKYLQGLAISKFAKSKISGVLFINFIAGFIQLPERYLSSLNKAVEDSDFIPKRVVLDVPIPDMIDDHEQLALLIEFCGEKGYSAALDDVKSEAEMDYILKKAAPDYIKIDRGLTSNHQNSAISERMKNIIAKARKKGCAVIAEGIEDRATYDAMHKLGADLFQGYYFAKPASIADVAKAEKKRKSV